MSTTPGAELEVVGVPQAVAAAVREVYLATGGQGLTAAVLEAAKDQTSALHGYFEWSDDKAAVAYRLSQAEDLVRRIKVKIIKADASPPIRVRAYISNRELPATSPGDTVAGSYTAIEELAGGTAAELALLESINRDVMRLRQKYKSVTDFLEVVTDILEDPEITEK